MLNEIANFILHYFYMTNSPLDIFANIFVKYHINLKSIFSSWFTAEMTPLGIVVWVW